MPEQGPRHRTRHRFPLAGEGYGCDRVLDSAGCVVVADQIRIRPIGLREPRRVARRLGYRRFAGSRSRGGSRHRERSPCGCPRNNMCTCGCIVEVAIATVGRARRMMPGKAAEPVRNRVPIQHFVGRALWKAFGLGPSWCRPRRCELSSRSSRERLRRR